MIASSRNAGSDEPFAFDLVTQSFVTVANVLLSNVPSSPATTGDWTPPTMDLVGVNLIVTHPGFGGGAGGLYFGWFDISTPGQPRWHAGNLYATGAIIALGTITGGSSYVPGTYYNVPLTGGTGSGAKADIVVNASGAVSSVALDIAGSAYVVSDSLSASNANLGGAGSGFSIPVTVIQTTGGIALTTPPTWVRQFYERAYFGINPATAQPSVVFTDVLGLGATNANQALTFGDNLPLVAAAPLGLSNQLGGIIQALMVFKDDSNIAQITGDYATSNLAINNLNVAVGTPSPRSICETPYGLMFLAADGFRLIDFDAHVNDPIGVAGAGVVVPFTNALFPTRVNAACNGQVMRVSLQSGLVSGNPWQEYWYDLVRKVWSGPHTFPSTMIDVYESKFIIAPQAVIASLWTSAIFPTTSSLYSENGAALSWTFQTAVLPDNQEMAESEIAELQVKLSATPTTLSVNVAVLDPDANVLAFEALSLAGQSADWDRSQWDESYWAQTQQQLRARRVDFSQPVVYNRMALQLQGKSAYGFRIGDIFLRQRVLGYIQQLVTAI